MVVIQYSFIVDLLCQQDYLFFQCYVRGKWTHLNVDTESGALIFFIFNIISIDFDNDYNNKFWLIFFDKWIESNYQIKLILFERNELYVIKYEGSSSSSSSSFEMMFYN